jgi:hypothetical protein
MENYWLSPELYVCSRYPKRHLPQPGATGSFEAYGFFKNPRPSSAQKERTQSYIGNGKEYYLNRNRKHSGNPACHPSGSKDSTDVPNTGVRPEPEETECGD